MYIHHYKCKEGCCVLISMITYMHVYVHVHVYQWIYGRLYAFVRENTQSRWNALVYRWKFVPMMPQCNSKRWNIQHTEAVFYFFAKTWVVKKIFNKEIEWEFLWYCGCILLNYKEKPFGKLTEEVRLSTAAHWQARKKRTTAEIHRHGDAELIIRHILKLTLTPTIVASSRNSAANSTMKRGEIQYEDTVWDKWRFENNVMSNTKIYGAILRTQRIFREDMRNRITL